MPIATGYTDLQAARLMQRVDMKAAKACDAVAEMLELVTDHNPHRKAYIQDVILSAANEAKDVVRRRTR